VSSAGPAEPPSTGGCLCPSGAEQLLEQTDHVFIGDLVEVKGEGDDIGTAVIRVRENFKGDLNGVVEVRDAAATRCSWAVFEMATPGRYVVFANDDPESIDMCSPVMALWEEDAKVAVTRLDRARGLPP